MTYIQLSVHPQFWSLIWECFKISLVLLGTYSMTYIQVILHQRYGLFECVKSNLVHSIPYDLIIMFVFSFHEGRLWIHAASKIPEPETIKAMEDFYREIYAVNGVTDLKFPEHYPVSRLLGDKFFTT